MMARFFVVNLGKCDVKESNFNGSAIFIVCEWITTTLCFSDNLITILIYC